MSFLAYIARDERIAAIHITDTDVSVGYFTRRSKHLADAKTTRVALPDGTIVGGRVADASALTVALRQLAARCRVRHVVVAIPHPAVFTKAVILPGALQENLDAARIAEARQLALAWNVPFAEHGGYADTDTIAETNGMMISAVAAADASAYFRALSSAGFRPVAIESEHAALARAMEAGANAITAIERSDHIDIVAVRGATLSCAESFSTQQLNTRQAVTREIKRVSEFVAATIGKKPVARTPEKLPLSEEVRAFLEEREDISLAPLAGALLRARIPRRDDVAASLMPIGTELAYEYQKLDAFVRMVGTITIVTGIVLCGAAGGMWVFMRNLRATLPELNTATAEAVERTIAEEKASYARFSEVVRTAGELTAEETSYAELIAFMRRYAISGIAVRNIVISGVQEPIRIVGVARSRAHLNAFRDALRSAPEVAAADLPITGAELRGEVPFTITLTLRDPTAWRTWRVVPAAP